MVNRQNNSSEEESETLLVSSGSNDVVKVGNSLPASFMLMLAFMLGSGFLTQAYVFRESGVALAPVLYVCAVTAGYLGCTYLLDVMANRRIYDFALVAADIFGDVGWWTVHIGIIIQMIGCIITYFILLGSMLQEVIITFAGGDSDWYTDLFFLTSLFILVTAPLSAFHQFSEMIWLAVFTFIMLLTGFFFVVIDGSLNASTYDSLSITVASGTGMLETIGFVVFALGMNVIVPTTYANSENSDRAAFDKVLLSSQVVGGILLCVVGLVGYLSFRSDTQVNIMDNFAGTTASVLKCVIMAHLLTYIPGCAVVARNSFYALLGADVNEETYWRLLGISGLFLTVIGLVAVLLQDYFGSSTALSNVINITGGISSAFLSFGMPGLLVLGCNITRAEHYYTPYIASTLIVFSVVTSVMVIVGIFY